MNKLQDYFPDEFSFMPMATKLPDEKILLYARNLINRQREDLKIEYLWQPHDALSECYCQGCKDLKSAMRVVRDFLITETRIMKAKQNRETDYHLPVTVKVCSSCHELKSVHEYVITVDPRTGLESHKGQCLSCRAKSNRNHSRKPKAKVKAKERWERYKERHAHINELKKQEKQKLIDDMRNECLSVNEKLTAGGYELIADRLKDYEWANYSLVWRTMTGRFKLWTDKQSIILNEAKNQLNKND